MKRIAVLTVPLPLSSYEVRDWISNNYFKARLFSNLISTMINICKNARTHSAIIYKRQSKRSDNKKMTLDGLSRVFYCFFLSMFGLTHHLAKVRGR